MTTIREWAVESAARALFLFDAGWAGIPGQETDQRFEQERRVYTARASAAFDAIIAVLMEPDGNMNTAGDIVLYGYEDMRSSAEVLRAMLREAMK